MAPLGEEVDMHAEEPSSSPPSNILVDIAMQSGVCLEQMIGCGAFSVVYKGTNKSTGREVAVKVESKQSRYPQLMYEAKVYKSLARGLDGMVPTVHWHGIVGNLNLMVMDLMGPSLEDVFAKCSHSLKQPSIAKIGLKMLSAVEYLHTKGFVHRHIKPENVVFHSQSLDRLYLIDFGMAKKFRDKTQETNHIAFQTNKSFIGDMDFASLRAHSGLQQSRRDDIESVAYILMYMSQGFLPWANQKADVMKECKGSSLVESIYPKRIAKFLRHARGLSFEAPPSYHYLRALLEKQELSPVRERTPSWCLPSDYNFVSDWVHHIVPKHKMDTQATRRSAVPAVSKQTSFKFDEVAIVLG